MRTYIVILIQLMIWSGYTLIEWLSKHDQLVYKVIMFFVFFYLAYFIGSALIKQSRKAIFVTVFSLTIYGSFHYTMILFLH
jgi:hypothetical protein